MKFVSELCKRNLIQNILNKNSYKNRVPYFDDFSYIPNNQNTEKYVEEIKRAGKFYGYLN